MISVGTIVDKGRYVVSRIQSDNRCILECNNYQRFRDDYCMTFYPHISELTEATQEEVAEYRKMVREYEEQVYRSYQQPEEKKEKTMAKQEIVYRNNEGKLVNAEFDSFEQAWPLIRRLDRKNVSYDWQELVNGQWRDASEVTVLQDEDISRYIVGQVA